MKRNKRRGAAEVEGTEGQPPDDGMRVVLPGRVVPACGVQQRTVGGTAPRAVTHRQAGGCASRLLRKKQVAARRRACGSSATSERQQGQPPRKAAPGYARRGAFALVQATLVRRGGALRSARRAQTYSAQAALLRHKPAAQRSGVSVALLASPPRARWHSCLSRDRERFSRPKYRRWRVVRVMRRCR